MASVFGLVWNIFFDSGLRHCSLFPPSRGARRVLKVSTFIYALGEPWRAMRHWRNLAALVALKGFVGGPRGSGMAPAPKRRRCRMVPRARLQDSAYLFSSAPRWRHRRMFPPLRSFKIQPFGLLAEMSLPPYKLQDLACPSSSAPRWRRRRREVTLRRLEDPAYLFSLMPRWHHRRTVPPTRLENSAYWFSCRHGPPPCSSPCEASRSNRSVPFDAEVALPPYGPPYEALRSSLFCLLRRRGCATAVWSPLRGFKIQSRWRCRRTLPFTRL